MSLLLSNPITWSQYRRVPLRTYLSAVTIFFVILLGLIYITAHLDRHPQEVFSGWASGLLGIQTLFMVLIGSFTLSSMIRSDITSNMIESHRIMPLSDRHAIAGYILAAAARGSYFFIAIFILGLIVTLEADLPPARWISANLILFGFTLFVWTLTAFLAFITKGAAAVVILFPVVALFGNAGLLHLFPAIVIFLGPLIGNSIFNLRVAQTDVSLPLILSFCAQFLVGSIFFAGACRKYRTPEATAFGPRLGILLLAAFVALSLLALSQWPEFQPVFMRYAFRDNDLTVPMLGSFSICLLIALTPLCIFAREYVQSHRRRVDDPAARRTVPNPFLAALLVVIVLSPLMLGAASPPTLFQFLMTLLALAGFSFSVIFFAAWIYLAINNAKLILGVWLALYCLLPLVFDAILHTLTDRSDEPVLQFFSTFSPLGLLIETWSRTPLIALPPVLFHLLIPLLPMFLYFYHHSRKSRAGGKGSAETKNGDAASFSRAP